MERKPVFPVYCQIPGYYFFCPLPPLRLLLYKLPFPLFPPWIMKRRRRVDLRVARRNGGAVFFFHKGRGAAAIIRGKKQLAGWRAPHKKRVEGQTMYTGQRRWIRQSSSHRSYYFSFGPLWHIYKRHFPTKLSVKSCWIPPPPFFFSCRSPIIQLSFFSTVGIEEREGRALKSKATVVLLLYSKGRSRSLSVITNVHPLFCHYCFCGGGGGTTTLAFFSHISFHFYC